MRRRGARFARLALPPALGSWAGLIRRKVKRASSAWLLGAAMWFFAHSLIVSQILASAGEVALIPITFSTFFFLGFFMILLWGWKVSR